MGERRGVPPSFRAYKHADCQPSTKSTKLASLGLPGSLPGQRSMWCSQTFTICPSIVRYMVGITLNNAFQLIWELASSRSPQAHMVEISLGKPSNCILEAYVVAISPSPRGRGSAQQCPRLASSRSPQRPHSALIGLLIRQPPPISKPT